LSLCQLLSFAEVFESLVEIVGKRIVYWC